jgi:hypothetical protein
MALLTFANAIEPGGSRSREWVVRASLARSGGALWLLGALGKCAVAVEVAPLERVFAGNQDKSADPEGRQTALSDLSPRPV